MPSLLQTGSKTYEKTCRPGVKIKSDKLEAILNKPVKATSLLRFKRQKLQVRGSIAHLPLEDPTNSSSATCKDQHRQSLKESGGIKTSC